jgi:hypothetical protein
MGAFEAMGEIHIHIDTGHGVLNPFRLIQYGDRISDVFHTYLIDFNPAMIPSILDVVHGYLP